MARSRSTAIRLAYDRATDLRLSLGCFLAANFRRRILKNWPTLAGFSLARRSIAGLTRVWGQVELTARSWRARSYRVGARAAPSLAAPSAGLEA